MLPSPRTHPLPESVELIPNIRIICSLALGLAIPLRAATAPPSIARGTRPNVLLLVMDDISDREMDRIPTPRFDALASEGMRFRRAYGAPVCSPARRMLTFGKYWDRDSGTPCTGQNYRLAQPSTDALSLPRMFHNAGYASALIGKWHLGSYPGVAEGQPWQRVAQEHGFDTWRAGLSANIRSPCIKLGKYDYWQRVDDSEVSISEEYNTQAVRDAALKWIHEQEATPTQPWFTMVCFQAAHGPFHTPPGMGVTGEMYSYRDQYEMMVRDLDQAIGALLDAVDLSETSVLLVGDNGTPSKVPFSKKESGRGKTTTFEGGIHVPMVWAGAGIRRGVETDALVSFVDVLPTLGELIDAPSGPFQGLDGISLVPVLGDPSKRAHDFIWAGCVGANVAPGGDYAVVTERWKLRLVNGVQELYDLEHDPLEVTDLAKPSNRDQALRTAGSEDEIESIIKQLAARLEEHRPVR